MEPVARQGEPGEHVPQRIVPDEMRDLMRQDDVAALGGPGGRGIGKKDRGAEYTASHWRRHGGAQKQTHRPAETEATADVVGGGPPCGIAQHVGIERENSNPRE